MRGSTLGFYHLNERTGDEMAIALRHSQAKALDFKADPGINIDILQERMMRIEGKG